MTTEVEALVELLMRLGAIPAEHAASDQPNLQSSYSYFLSLSNGGYTPDYFFHFFGTLGPREHNLRDWNKTELWKKYFSLDDQQYVFAEDVFGTQFFFDVRGNRRVVKMLVPDTGKIDLCSNTFEDFLKDEVFRDEFNVRERELARRFLERRQTPYSAFLHISRKKPVVFGGALLDLQNLEWLDSVSNMEFLGQLVSQTRDLPPGASINRVNLIPKKK